MVLGFLRGGKVKAGGYELQARYGRRGKFTKITELETIVEVDQALIMLETPELYSKLRLVEMNNGVPVKVLWTEDNPDFDESTLPPAAPASVGKGEGRIVIAKGELDEYKEFLKTRMDAGLDLMKEGYEAGLDIMKTSFQTASKVTVDQVKGKIAEAEGILEAAGKKSEGKSGEGKGKGIVDEIVEGIVGGIASALTEGQIKKLKERKVQVDERE